MAEQFMDHLLEAILAASFALCAFLVRSFFSRIHGDLRDLKSSIDKLSGRFDGLREEARETTTALAVTQQELRAVWRTLDGGRRVSDHLNGEED